MVNAIPLACLSSQGKRMRLLRTASIAALVAGLAAAPAEAQLARLRAGNTLPGATGNVAAGAAPVRPANMRAALERAGELRNRVEQARAIVTSARNAAVAATRVRPADGLSANGLDPVASIREAIALSQSTEPADRARAQQLLANASAANDPTGKNTWEGSGLPVQSSENGRVVVTIKQEKSRSLLSWNRLDVGTNTTLRFDQKQNGVVQPGWTVVNRVVDSIAPTTILGRIEADANVFVLNRRGVIFGEGSQVNLGSLVASSLELGNFGKNPRQLQLPGDINARTYFDPTTLADRNRAFLDNGAFQTSFSGFNSLPPLFLSPALDPGLYAANEPLPGSEGGVTVDAGAQITARTGGFIVLAAPTVENSGSLITADGQVSLQGGRLITYAQSTGASNAIDPDVRGFVLRTIGNNVPAAPGIPQPRPEDGLVINRGYVESRRGFLSFGAGLFGEVVNEGVLFGTTSVARNAKIALNAGKVSIAGSGDPQRSGMIVILPDENGETIPQGSADEPPTFKSSVIEIGARVDGDLGNSPFLPPEGIIVPSIVTFGNNTLLLAPNARVTVAGPTTIGEGATIDVSGVKDVAVDVSRNIIAVSPLKRNELRDTPNYREVSLTGDFTLNGETLFVDIRRTGVRADGVRWVGSPLIEAGSLASQIPVTAAELMTTGGSVTFSSASSPADPAAPQAFSIARDAVIDISGGWVRYTDGILRTSKLLTADGRIVDVADADPNDNFVAVASGFSEFQPRAGISDVFLKQVLAQQRFQAGYDEGRDAGSLSISGAGIRFDGAIFGNAYAGAFQIAAASQPSRVASGGDPRRLQQSPLELPAGGFVRLGSFEDGIVPQGGADIVVYRGDRGLVQSSFAETLLSDRMLSAAGLSALTLQTSGSVVFAAAGQQLLQPDGAVNLTGNSELTLAAGGVLTVDAGRTIRFDGAVSIASGTIRAQTLELAPAPILGGSLAALGSIYRSDDDIAGLYGVDSDLPSPFDIVVTGTLSTAGRWVNDLTATDVLQGSAWLDGGTISLTVAPKVLVALGDSVATATVAGDLSGSIIIDPAAELNVSGGGYVGPDRLLILTSKGGNVSLINTSTYASILRTDLSSGLEDPGQPLNPIFGSNQTVDFTPGDDVTPSLVPDADKLRARVSFNTESIKGFGFSEGGTFTLISPEIGFDGKGSPNATDIPLDFLQRTGFGELELTSYKSRIIADLFNNARVGNSAFFETTSLVVGAGRTLDLTQTLLPAFLNAGQVDSLLALSSGSDVTNVLVPAVPQNRFDQRAARLTLGGFTELIVEEGGSITGAPGAAIVTPKLLNAGSIVLKSGSIEQFAVLPQAYVDAGLAVADLSEAFGEADANGRFDENAINPFGITNRALVAGQSIDRLIYFRGLLDGDEGIRLDQGSLTDLSGVALFDPRAPFLANGQQLRIGRVLDAGTISTASIIISPNGVPTTFADDAFGGFRYSDPSIFGARIPELVAGRRFVAESGSVISLAGASAIYDELIDPRTLAPAIQWSNGGNLSGRSGGSVAGAQIDAHGGAASALGGTLEWFNPVIAQTSAPGDDTIGADDIMAAGFDTLIARGSVAFSGDVALDLDRAFILTSPTNTEGRIVTGSPVVVTASDGARASIDAPYIRLVGVSAQAGAFSPITGNALISFTAGTAGIDLVGSIRIDSSVSETRFVTSGDIRFSGVDPRVDQTQRPTLDGQLIAAGDLSFDAARIFATTGTGNLQQLFEDRRAGRNSSAQPYLIAAAGASTIRFGRTGNADETPLSAGTWLRVLASDIQQGGFLSTPLGALELGTNASLSVGGRALDGTATVNFLAGSVTSVSGGESVIPYGTTADLTEYFFTPSGALPLTTTPVGQFSVSGADIDVAAGATVDLSGGGDIFAFEFVSGTGGSRDVLDRFNRDRFSSNGFDPAIGQGFQFADQRQVFAIVPVAAAKAIADFDPIYSADYGVDGPVDLYGAGYGLSVTVDDSAGLPGGEYLLLPAHYALLPGAFRVVENTDLAAPAPGGAQTLLDGSLVVGGRYSYADSEFAESQRRSFTIQSANTFLKFSRIETTGGSEAIANRAETLGEAIPRLPVDAARAVLSPLTALRVAGLFDTAIGEDGRGAQIDIGGRNIVIAREESAPIAGTVTLSQTTLENLNPNSLLLGAERTDNADGSTDLGVLATSIVVRGDVDLALPEIILAVGGIQPGLIPTIEVEDGAQLRATGVLADDRTGDLVVPSLAEPPIGYRFDNTGVGAVLRLANGAERLVRREGDFAARNTGRPAVLRIGEVTITGAVLALDSSRNFFVDPAAALDAPAISLSGDVIRFNRQFIAPELTAILSEADRLTLRSPDAVGFADGTYQFNNLVIDSPGIGLANTAGQRVGIASDVTLETDSFRWRNSASDLGDCGAAGARACSNTSNTLIVNANEIAFGSGSLHVYGFDRLVSLTGRQGIFVEGEGALDIERTNLVLETPVLIDRAAVADPRQQQVRPDFTFRTRGSVTVTRPAGALAPQAVGLTDYAAVVGNRAIGARINFGIDEIPISSLTIDGTLIGATAGVINARVRDDIVLVGNAQLVTPGFERRFGDDVDSVTVSAGGGAIDLLSREGSIVLPTTSLLVTDSGVGAAGSLLLRASRGAIDFSAALNQGVTARRDGSLVFDARDSEFDLAGFVNLHGNQFGGSFVVRSGVGDLDLGAGQLLRARSVSLTADGGSIAIGGTIDTSGVDVTDLSATAAADARVNGGDIELYGQAGVTLASTALLDTHSTGYRAGDTRSASAGDVSIGIGATDAAIIVADGARIDLGARRTEAAHALGESGNRLVAQVVKDPNTLADTTVYRFVEADLGGKLSFRAPVIGAAGDEVDIQLASPSAIRGASEVQVEAFRRYDLDAIAERFFLDYVGVSSDGETVFLDLLSNLEFSGFANPLVDDFVGADGLVSVPHFIRNFNVRATDGSPLDGFRLRPGIDLETTRDIRFLTNWNLAAGIVDQQAALDAGVLQLVPELGIRDPLGDNFYYFLVPGAGQLPTVSVTPGAEGRLLEEFTDFLYRVGGKASGEAGIITLRARGDLNIDRSISDGFFSFRDQSDPAYVNYQLGGGNRTFNPAVQFSCGGNTADCSAETVRNFSDVSPGEQVPNGNAVTISLLSALQGRQESARFVSAPFSALANTAAAIGSGVDIDTGEPAGDPLNSAELFPLLPDGSAIRSTDVRLVGGADQVLSANPLHIDIASDASVRVSDETQGSYRIEAVRGGAGFGGSTLQVRFSRAGTNDNTGQLNQPILFDIGSFFDESAQEDEYGISQLDPDAYTVLTWGGGGTASAQAARAQAVPFFTARGRSFTGTPLNPAGVRAPLSEVIEFLTVFAPTFVDGIVNNRPGYVGNPGSPPTVINYTQDRTFVQSYVRTGAAGIAIAAAQDVDLRGTIAPVYRNEAGGRVLAANTLGAQVGGAAIYSAGRRLAATRLTARIEGGALVEVDPASELFAFRSSPADFLPGPKGLTGVRAAAAGEGGNIFVAAGRDVLGRRDEWSERFLETGSLYGSPLLDQRSTLVADSVGAADQRWRPGAVGQDTEAGIQAQLFGAGLGALAGGDVDVYASRDISDLTIALDSSIVTEAAATTSALLTFGSGDLDVRTGRDLLAGQFDIAVGQARLDIGRDLGGFGREANLFSRPNVDAAQFLRVRVNDATARIVARGDARLAGVSALGQSTPGSAAFNSAGSFTAIAGINVTANEGVEFVGNRRDQSIDFGVDDGNPATVSGNVFTPGFVAPGRLEAAALTGSIELANSVPQLLYPSPIGQVSLLATGDISSLSLVMSDADPSLLFGVFAVPENVGLGRNFPGTLPVTSDRFLRLFHNERITHLGDPDPSRIYTDGSIQTAYLSFAEQVRIGAGRDLVDVYFSGQNVSASDVTRIVAGRDIRSTTGTSFNLPYLVANNFVLGGPGAFFVEAGRNLGPFINSAVVAPAGSNPFGGVSFAGGIRTVGNEQNPWLSAGGADLFAFFGVANGINYAGFRETYLNPENASQLDGDLFVQVADVNGNLRPDRTRPIYAPILADWLRDNDIERFASVFGAEVFPDTPTGNAALATAAYARFDDLYTAFASLDLIRQQEFLLNEVYFNELSQPSLPDSPSFNQFVRGYRAVDALFPPSLGYTDNLAVYTTDPSTISEDRPLGTPVRNIVNGELQRAETVQTGSVDLRLATIETARGGDITILGPGGDLIAGSVVRTSEQAARRRTRFAPDALNVRLEFANLISPITGRIDSIPLGFEGILTLRGGAIRGFTDGDLRVNQSRVFTQAGGDIAFWSSNGDLNAGQGPRSAANFPPVTVRFDSNGATEVDSAGSVSGAGIGAFRQSPDQPLSSIILIAPVGEVDAGDAGVRASGNVFVAAARVANAENFSAGGDISGVPALAATVAPPPPTAAAAAIVAQVARIGQENANANDRRSLITVDVLGYSGGDRCQDPDNNDPDCPR